MMDIVVTREDVALAALKSVGAVTGTVPLPIVSLKAFVIAGASVTPRTDLAALESLGKTDTANGCGEAFIALVTPGGIVVFTGWFLSLASSGLTTTKEVTGVTKLYLIDKLVAFSVRRRRAVVSLARNRACSRS